MSENLLRNETSPYLLQHRDNPVHWRPWGADAFEEARRLNKPILLSIGYSACHWCHVMAHESFENPEIAAVMNDLFVNVKVDREERPDVDQIYMEGLLALGGRGGWPLTVFLTPDGDLFWGGTYFPPTARFGRAGFPDILRQVADVYRNTPDRIQQNAAAVAAALKPHSEAGVITRDLVDRTARSICDRLDPVNGGFMGAPKFPQASLFEFLFRAGDRSREQFFFDAFLLAMTRICQGGIFDHVGGGFARYSTDERWFAPHFEKMLYDNAHLISLLTYAWKISKNPLFERRIAQTISWLEREMLVDGGAFAASLDADSEGQEGKFYVWTSQELEAALGTREARTACEAFGATAQGNWEHTNILHRLDADDVSGATDEALDPFRQKLLAARALRVRPHRDDKVLADWNGLMIEALCHAGSSFTRPEWIALGERAYGFIETTMVDGNRIGHSARLGRVSRPGLSSDAACTVAAALALYQVTQNSRYLVDAQRFQEGLDNFHFDSESGYFLNASDMRDLARRPGGAQDDVAANANAKSAKNLVRLGLLTGEMRYLEKTERLFQIFGGAVDRMPLAFLDLMNAFDFASRTEEAVILGAAEVAQSLMTEVFQSASPNLILTCARSGEAVSSSNPAFQRPMLQGRPTAYLCRGGSCSLPITEPQALRAALSRS